MVQAHWLPTVGSAHHGAPQTIVECDKRRRRAALTSWHDESNRFVPPTGTESDIAIVAIAIIVVISDHHGASPSLIATIRRYATHDPLNLRNYHHHHLQIVL